MASIPYGRLGNNQSWFERGMDGWRHVIQVSERTLIDNVAATVPWLAPVSPAYMVWHNAVNLLGWPVWVAWVVAAAVEGLGLSVVSTAFSLWKTRSAAFWVAVSTTFFYLAIIITVNVALELGAPVWIAKALLSLLSVPAAVTIALRSQQAQAVEDIRAAEVQRAEVRSKEEENSKRLKIDEEQREYLRRVEAEERAQRLKLEEEQRAYQRQVDAEERERRHELKLLKAQGKVSESFRAPAETTAKVLETFRDWRKVPASEREKIANMTIAEIMEHYGKIERTAANWKKEAMTWKSA